MTNHVQQILYISQSIGALSTAVCEDILAVARKNNKRDGVTGFLACLPNGAIIQILEGDADTVSATYERISRDSRHHSLAKLLDLEGEERLFSEWFMGFRMVKQSEVGYLPDFINLSGGEVSNVLDGTSTPIKMLRSIFLANTIFD